MASQQPPTTGKAVLDRNPDKFLSRSVYDLISLKGRTIVITGGGRGLGLAFGFAVAEVGGNVAIIDLLDKPHDHFQKLETEFGVKVKLYKSVSPQGHGLYA
jgi:sorbose reductase